MFFIYTEKIHNEMRKKGSNVATVSVAVEPVVAREFLFNIVDMRETTVARFF